MTSTILECSEVTGSSIVNGDWVNNFSQSILREGDVIQMKMGLINTKSASSQNIVLDVDTDISVEVGFYDNPIDKNVMIDNNLKGKYQDFIREIYVLDASGAVVGSGNPTMKYNSKYVAVVYKDGVYKPYTQNITFTLPEGSYTPQYFGEMVSRKLQQDYNSLLLIRDLSFSAVIDSGNGKTLLSVPLKDIGTLGHSGNNNVYEMELDSSYFLTDLTYLNVSFSGYEANSGSADDIAMADYINSNITFTATGSVYQGKNYITVDLPVAHVGVLKGVNPNGKITVAPTTGFFIEEDKLQSLLDTQNAYNLRTFIYGIIPLRDLHYAIGCPSAGLNFTDGSFTWSNLHLPLKVGNGSDTGTAPYVKEIASAYRINDIDNISYVKEMNGCFLTELLPKDLWDAVGYDDVLLNSGIQNTSTHSFVGVDAETINSTTFQPGQEGQSGFLINIAVSDSTFVSPVNAFQPDVKGYYLLETITTFMTKYKSEGGRHGHTTAVISLQNNNADYITSYGSESSIPYIHSGEPVEISTIRTRILNPITRDVVASLGDNSTVFMEIISGNGNGTRSK